MKNTREIIKDLCTARDMSLTDLERTLGIGNGTICKWDKAMPNTQKLIAVADFFDVSLDYLVGRTSTKVQDSFNATSIDALYAGATAEDKAVIDLILSKYKKDIRVGSAG